MAIVIATNKTKSELKTLLDAEVSAILIGGDYIYRLTDSIDIQADVDISGFTLIFADTFGIWTSTVNGICRSGYLSNGNIEGQSVIIYEADTPFDDNTITDATSMVKVGSKWISYGLTIIQDKPSTNDGIVLYEPNSDSIFESLSYISAIQTSFSCYLTIQLSASAVVSIQSLRNSNLRYDTGILSFVNNGQGWMRGQKGQDNLKLLANNKTFTEFIPKFPNVSAGIETTNNSFNATTMSFVDSYLEPSQILGYPTNNDGVIRVISRNFEFSPVDGTGSPINNLYISLYSNKVASVSYVGDVSGLSLEHRLENVSSGTEQLVQVYRGYRATIGALTYKALEHELESKDISVYYYVYGKNIGQFTTNTYLGKETNRLLLPDDILVTEINSATVSGYLELENAFKIYDSTALYLVENSTNETSFLVSREGSTLQCKGLDVIFDSSAVDNVSLSGNQITFKSSIYNGNIDDANTLHLESISEDSILSNVLDTTIETLPLKLSLDNSFVTFNTSIDDSIDLTDWTLSAGSEINIIGTTGTLTLITGGNTGWIINDNTTGGVLIREDGLITPISIENLSNANVQIINNSGIVATRSVNVNGTFNYSTPIGSVGSWKVVVDRAGYIASVFNITADGLLKSFDGTLIELLQPSGVSMYQGTSSLFCSVVPNPDGSRMNIRIGDGLVSAQNIFDEVELALSSEDGMSYLSNGGGRCEFLTLATGTFLFLKTNVRLIRDLVSDSNATVQAFVQSTDGQVLDNTNGDVTFVTVTKAQQLAEYSGSIWIDTVNGVDSGAYPFGTQASPCKTFANANSINSNFKLDKYNVDTGGLDYMIDANVEGVEITGTFDVLDMNNKSFVNVEFNKISIKGIDSDNTKPDLFNGCWIIGNISCRGIFRDCVYSESIVTTTGDSFVLGYGDSMVAGTGSVVFNNTGNYDLSIRGWKGGFTLFGMTGGKMSFGGSESRLTIDSSCSGSPEIVVRGSTRVVNNSSVIPNVDDKSIVGSDFESVVSSSPTISGIKTQTDKLLFTGDNLNANIKAISDSTISADALELQYDGTGLSGVSYPSTQGQVSNISVTGSAVNTISESFTLTNAVVSSGTFEDTHTLDGIRHVIVDNADNFDIYYEFNLSPTGVPTGAKVIGALTGVNDEIGVYAWNWITELWNKVGFIEGSNSTNNTNNSYDLLTSHVGSGVNVGKSRIRFFAPSTDISNPTLYIDQLIVTQTFAEGGIANGSTVTLTESVVNSNLVGNAWKLELANQNIGGSYIYGSNNVSGIGVSTNINGYWFNNCNLFDCTLSASGQMTNCILSTQNTITLISTSGVDDDIINMVNGSSGVAGTDSPSIDISAVTKNTSLSLRRWSGGLKVTSNEFCTTSVDVVSGGNINIYGTGGLVVVRGICIVNDLSGGLVEIQTPSVINKFTISESAKNILHEGMSQGSGSGTAQIQLSSDASSISGSYDPSMVFITSGSGEGQSRLILEYNGDTKIASVDRSWKVLPDATSNYIIESNANVVSLNEGLLQGATINTATLNTLACVDDDCYVGQMIWLRGSTGEDQTNLILGYNGTTKVATLERNWSQIPDNTTTYMIIPSSPSLLAETVHIGATIPNVTLVDTTSVNTDMRGTDSANTINPDNASITSILQDTNELQTNQGDWITATGFSTPTDVSNSETVIISKIDAQTVDIKGASDKDLTQVFDNSPTVDLSIVTDAIDAQTVNLKGASDKDLTEVYNNTPSIDPSSVWSFVGRSLDTAVETDTDSRIASKADVSLLATEVNATANKNFLSSRHDYTVSEIAGVETKVDNLNDFNPITDTVSHVTLVDTTTSNTDMIGTDGAITSLSGIATESNATSNKNSIEGNISANQTALIAEHNQTQTDISNIADNTTEINDIKETVERNIKYHENKRFENEDGTLITITDDDSISVLKEFDVEVDSISRAKTITPRS